MARTVTFPSVVIGDGDTQLVQVKAVGERYPLRGRLRVAAANDAPPVSTDSIPARGQVWADERLMLQLDLSTGVSVGLGGRGLKLSRIIDYEPDRGGQWFQLAPRVMINLADLPSTGLITANSRVSYNTLLAGPATAIEAYRQWLEPRALPGEEIQGVEDGRPEMRAALNRAQQYLGLAALVAVLVAGAAIALAARHYAARQADASAIMRCLGASQALVLRIYAWRLSLLGLCASLAACAFGYLAQTVLTVMLEGWLAHELPQPGLAPVATGVFTGWLALMGFALPPILRLKQIPPLRVLHRDLGNPAPAAWITGAFAFCALGLLLVLQAHEAVLIGKLLLGATLTVGCLWLVSFALIVGIRRLQRRSGGVWRNALARLGRRPADSVLQISAFALGLAALLVLAIARVDVLDIWRGQVPANAPNYFLINIQRADLQVMRRLFRDYRLPAPRFYAVVRGRLTAINGREIVPEDYEDPHAKQHISREFNLSWARRLQGDNEIKAGQWWGVKGADSEAFSIEVEIAETLGIELGDRLRYRIAGEAIEAPVTSIRQVEWDSFNANFFVVATPGLLANQPASFITAFYLPPESESFITALANRFPSVTPLNVEAIVEQVRAIMDRAALAVEYVFLFTLAAGLLVMYAAIQTTQQERRREIALLRTLGASREQICLSLIAEFGAIGIVAGVLAAFAASVAGYLLATQIFELPYRVNLWLWVWGVGAGGAGILTAGVLGTHRLLHQSPLMVLRRA
jgi:putative ABC transport system permease protein